MSQWLKNLNENSPEILKGGQHFRLWVSKERMPRLYNPPGKQVRWCELEAGGIRVQGQPHYTVSPVSNIKREERRGGRRKR